MAEYIKWHITQKKGTDSYNALEACEFYLYDKSGNKMSWQNGTTAESSLVTWSGEGADKLIDGTVNGKYGTPNWGSSVYGDDVITFTIPGVVSDEIGGYSFVTARDDINRTPVSWELLFSKDGTNYNVVDTQTNVNVPTTLKTETQVFTINLGTKKYLISSSGTVYTIIDGALSEVEGALTAQLFIDNGIDTVPDGSLLLNLSNPSVMCWTDAEELPVINANVTATPKSQNVISNAIDLTHKSITGIESATANCDGELIIAVSFDNKQTWKAWNGSEWSTLSEDFTGMNKETLESITFEQWNLLFTGASSFYIRVSLIDTTQSVTEIIVDFAN